MKNSPLGTREVKDLILKLRDEGKTVLMCSHLLQDVQDVCDRIAILYGGELKVLGNVKDLLETKGETQLITSKLDAAAVSEVEAVLKKHGATLHSSASPMANLEELFLRTVEESKARPGRRYAPGETPKA